MKKIIILCALLSGCTQEPGMRTLQGAGIGAGSGALIGGVTNGGVGAGYGAVSGAALGAGIGYITSSDFNN